MSHVVVGEASPVYYLTIQEPIHFQKPTTGHLK